jgi:hypothetical protein
MEAFMPRKRRHHSGFESTPSSTPRPLLTTTGAKHTRVRDPRAAVRFSLDDRVTWDESLESDGSKLVYGTIDAFLEDECMVRIRIEGGGTTLAPTFSSRLKHARVSLPPESNDTVVEMAPMEEIRYMEVDYSDSETIVPGMTQAELTNLRTQVGGFEKSDTIPAPKRLK